MWHFAPSSDSLTRPRIAVAVVSAIAAASVGYYAWQSQGDYDNVLIGQGLHRSNAVRRSRRSRRASASSYASHTDENNALESAQAANDGETLVEEWWNDPLVMQPPARAGHNIVSLLFRVSEDNARRNACVHRGCACNSCGMVPIRGVRYRCANCADFDLCETCESQGVHIRTHIFYKIRIPAPPFGPRQMQPVWYAGDPDTCIKNLPRGLINKLSKETGFERPEIEAFWEQFTFMANTEWREDPDGLQLAMDKKTFERCLVPSGGSRHATPNLIHDRMFSFYDTNNDDLIGFAEFLQGLAYRKRRDKLRRIFQGYDIDGDGFVNRRDFLRMFRAYYVLYKQMHRDILDGLDDQLMGSQEAQQLVTSRQPLSSLFGREARVPRDNRDLTGEGKVFHPNGDVELEEGESKVINADRGDTSAREDVLTRLFAATGNMNVGHTSWPTQMGSPDSQPYWDALLDPPRTLDELPALLIGSRRHEDEEDLDDAELTSPEEESAPANRLDEETRAQAGDGLRVVNGDDSSPSRVDPSQYTSTMPTESQLRARFMSERRRLGSGDRNRRAETRKLLHERWKRRNFYLDEEEGGAAPEGWNEDEDLLANLNGVPGSSKAAQSSGAAPRSRSSSKVRFADDGAEHETQSHWSQSAHSFGIPDEERDAGKEILYQVTQQAFNELLDAIFKKKEELAFEAAETRASRNKYRSLFEDIDVEDLDDAEELDDTSAEGSPVIRKRQPEGRSLDELLHVSGYTVDTDLVPETTPNTASAADPEARPEPVSEEPAAGSVDEAKDAEDEPVEGPREPHQDPTMPQFRPNSDVKPHDDKAQTDVATAASTPGKEVESTLKTVKGSSEEADEEVSHAKLINYKRLDMAEKEAEERGGWGKLSFEEFEDIYKTHEIAGNRLDYLGSWVDFCIP
ncbi:hypothetical protein VD0002_g197 [Verticillium dahliae]|uniref:EF hand domain-containing protein n=2 Tax=Verticillium dahliae TaxID=27337 RepID=G2WTN9_VERDV|nr:EF hand domain-containing protein [Verticillium dahliae VdLs.17]KAF3348507.1 hypothetical protein VdG2_03389 [Verticillium dahliae VDG2]KAH6691057.1 EF hand domain-containing protein [Verticillium dahliae]EGY17480.1 EF hand domain-containing protein [Verticillium dahliae VdLs.17]PNH35455.1 hypothetical protein BJF96_g1175 [Verticillium dahliae]PNH57376.1 hypothetical protein VD0003_g371 [Verticillium dahliae]